MPMARKAAKRRGRKRRQLGATRERNCGTEVRDEQPAWSQDAVADEIGSRWKYESPDRLRIVHSSVSISRLERNSELPPRAG